MQDCDISAFVVCGVQVQRKQQLIIQNKNDLGETEDRVFAMTEHLKNVRQELLHTQVILSPVAVNMYRLPQLTCLCN